MAQFPPLDHVGARSANDGTRIWRELHHLTLLIGAPFYVVLTRRTMELVSVEPFSSANTGLTALVQETVNAVLRELSKIRRFIPWLLLASVISFILVINALVPIVWLFVNSWIFAFSLWTILSMRVSGRSPRLENGSLKPSSLVWCGRRRCRMCERAVFECRGVSSRDYRRVSVSRVQPIGLNIAIFKKRSLRD